MLSNVVLIVALAAPTPARVVAHGDTVRAPVPVATTRVACPPLNVADSTSTCAAAPADTVRRRPRAIEYSDWYARRLEVHRIGSYVMLPLFATEYVLGERLINGADPHSTIGSAHALTAGGIAVLFTVNTATGLWNLWDSRSERAGRTRRTIHSITMLTSDAGFVLTGVLAGNAKHSSSDARRHRDVALGSIGISTLGTAMMWLWKS